MILRFLAHVEAALTAGQAMGHMFGLRRVTRWVLVFLGAIQLEYGAGLAGGRTSGLGLIELPVPPRLTSWATCSAGWCSAWAWRWWEYDRAPAPPAAVKAS
jgi:hypothetical protein